MGNLLDVRRSRPRDKLMQFATALLFSCLATAAFAVPYDPGPLQFQTTGQGMWGPGAAATLDTERFLGDSWNTAPVDLGIGIGGSAQTRVPGTGGSIPNPLYPVQYAAYLVCKLNPFNSCTRPPTTIPNPVPAQYVDTRTGYDATAATSGKAGFNLGAHLDSGSVNAQVSFSVALDVPQAIQIGQFIDLNPNSSLAGGQLSTNLAEASAHVDAVLGVKGNFTGQACFVALGCTAAGNTSIGFDPQTLPLASFGKEDPNDPSSETVIKILGVADPALFQFGSEISIPSPIPGGSVGGITLHVPDIDTLGGVAGNKLKSSGQDDFIDLRLDLDGLIGATVGLPGGGISVDAGIFSISADLVDVDLGPTIVLKQDFELTPTLHVDLQFDQPVLVAGSSTPVTSLSSLWDSLPSIALLFSETSVTPTFWIDGLFMNSTYLGIDGVFQLDVLKASLALQAFGLSVDVGDLGPLFQVLERDNLFDTPPLFLASYDLEGFNRVNAAPFLLQTSAAVPEPGTLLLLAIAALGMGFAPRRVETPREM